METVTNLASGVVNTATKVIWGEGTTAEKKANEIGAAEPISGQTGDVKQGEPYDKGNLPTPAAEANPFAKALSPVTDTTTPANTTAASTLPETTSTTTSSTLPNTAGSISRDTTSSANLADSTTSKWKPETALPIRSEEETTKTGVESANTTSNIGVSSASNTAAPHTTDSKIASSNDPSSDAPSLTARPKEEHQGGQNPLAEPETEEEKHATGNTGTTGTPAAIQKGVHHDASSATPGSSKSAPGTPAKVSLKDKIKAKLHRHKDSSE